MRSRALLVFAAAVGITTACESSTEAELRYSATLSGAQETPAITTTATGAFTATIDEATNVMTYNVAFQGLGSNATLAHIHGPAVAGVAANILVDLNAAASGRIITLGGTSGTGSGTINLTAATLITATVSGDSLRKLFDAGQLYVNIHSVTNGGGEIRGQITRQ